MSEHHSRHGLSELEQALKTLVPAAVSIDRDQVLFRAGQRLGARTMRVWQAAAVLFALATGGLAGAWVLRAEPEPLIRTVEVRVEVPVPVAFPERKPPAPEPPLPEPEQIESPRSTEPPRQLARHRLQHDVLRWGLDGLPALPREAGNKSRPPAESIERALTTERPFASWSLFSFGEN